MIVDEMACVQQLQALPGFLGSCFCFLTGIVDKQKIS
jgi:hypothetical protein